MKIVQKKLSDLKKPEKNVRVHTQQQLTEFERSVRMFGQIRPIVIDEDNTILAGNGLYDTLIKMGETKADCFQYTNLTANQKKKLMIADNKIFSLGIDNLDVLNEIIEDLKDDLDIPGLDEEILRQMVSDADEVTQKIAEYGTMDDAEIAALKARAQEQPSEQGAAQSAPTVISEGDSGTPDQTPPGGEQGETKRYVICPSCGETIWL